MGARFSAQFYPPLACGWNRLVVRMGGALLCPSQMQGMFVAPGGNAMRIPTRPLFKPFDYALMVAFAMAFVMLTTLRLA